MKKAFYLFAFFIFVTSLLSNCTTSNSSAPEEEAKITKGDIENYITTLASDEFEGRKPFSKGEVKTINFLKEEFQKMGLEPGNGDSYFQDVPLVEIDGHPSETTHVKGPKAEFDLQLKDDIMFVTEREQAEIEIKESELVFCGYGIVAPEYNWNDYEGIDMKGKTAVVLVNDPGYASEDSTLFKGKTMTYYGRWDYKFAEAARQGAEACLVIHERAAAGYPWFVVKSSWSGSQLHLQTPDGNASKCGIVGWISLTSTSKIFRASDITQTRLFEKAMTPGFKPIPLNVTISTSISNTFKKDVSKNVVAKLPGSERPDEYVIYTAHWDHLGVGQPVKEDSIYNGALDNATGTSSLLCIAKAFFQLKKKPERSILFLAVTAEEQGLLGSAHYAQNPIYPLNKTVALINMDGANINGEMKDLTITGIGQSEMDDYAREAAQKQDRYILPEQEPEKGFFYRSDQFSFALVGVPSLYAKGGYDHREKGKEYAMEKRNEYTTINYHRPSDEYDAEKWDLTGMIQDAQLYFNIGNRIANENTWPAWKEGSEFKSKRMKN